MMYEGFLGDIPFTVKGLNISDLQRIEELQHFVIAALPDNNILQPLSREELQNILDGNGLMIGAFVEERLIAFRALLVPKVNEDEHLGVDIAASDLSRVLYQEISNVHPDFRGFGLQKVLANIIMLQVDVSKFDWVCATVMPYNVASLKDKFAQGMQIFALKYKYGGKLRYVFAKSLGAESVHSSEPVFVSMGEVEAQQELLKNGYFGVAMEKRADDWFVEYRK
ncbi:GNAT family N-acetyltransferase [Solibacillus sp. CAU 1738]|uniref:GNAT family N-acetyltransferase n=1 Tax=Solibacillus sp. CAU 1738 TaxID=3140363 RepID=UPI0032601377